VQIINAFLLALLQDYSIISVTELAMNEISADFNQMTFS
jgi:hypothetical protein